MAQGRSIGTGQGFGGFPDEEIVRTELDLEEQGVQGIPGTSRKKKKKPGLGMAPTGFASSGESPFVESMLSARGAVSEERLSLKRQLDYEEFIKKSKADAITPIEKVAAAFQLNNSLSALVGYWSAYGPAPFLGPADPTYTPYEGDEITGYEAYADQFSLSRNAEETAYIKRKIDLNLQNQRIMENAGATGIISAIAAGVADPFNLALMATPVGWTVKGGQVGETALRSIIAGAAATSANEIVLHSQQPLRTPEETLFNMSVVALADGVIGAAIGKLTKAQRSVLEDEIRGILNNNGAVPPDMSNIPGFGAAATRFATGGALKSVTPIAKYSGIGLLSRGMLEGSPAGRLMTSEITGMRRTAQELIEIAPEVEGDYLPTSVYTKIKLDNAKFSEIRTELLNMEKQFKTMGTGGDDFTQLVAYSMRNGDKHENPIIAQAATLLRKKVYDPLWEEAIRLKLPGTTDADGKPMKNPEYLQRMYDVSSVRRDPKGFMKRWREGIEEAHAREKAEYEKAANEIKLARKPEYEQLRKEKAEAEGIRTKLQRTREDVNVQERQASLWKLKEGSIPEDMAARLMRLRKRRDALAEALQPVESRVLTTEGMVAARNKELSELKQPGKLPETELEWTTYLRDVYNNVISLRRGDFHATAALPTPGVFKPRAPIRDSFLQPYLEKDVFKLSQHYIDTIGPRVRMAEQFGDWKMDARMTELYDQHNIDAQRLETAGKIKEASDLRVKFVKDMDDMVAVRDQILHQTHGVTSETDRMVKTTLRTMRNYNVVRLLGSVLLANLPDHARVIAYHGLLPYANALAKSLGDLKLSSVPKNQLAKIVSAVERTNNTRTHILMDIEGAEALTVAEQKSREFTTAFVMSTGISHFTSLNKTMIGHLFGDKLVESFQKGINKEKLRHLGIGMDMQQRVSNQIKAHAHEEGGLWNPRVDLWTDKEAIEMVEAAAIKEADTVVVTPAPGERALLLTGDVGALVGQFQAFSQAAVLRMALPLLQERGLRPYFEILALTSMGYLAYASQSVMRGEKPSNDPKIWLANAIDRTGMTGYAMELYKRTANIMGFQEFTHDPQKYMRSGVESVLGPTGGALEAMGKVLSTTSTGDTRAKAFRQLLPFQNHILMRRGFDELEQQIAETLGGTGQRAGAGFTTELREPR